MEFLPCEEIKEFTIIGMNVESTSNFDVVIDHYKYTNIKKWDNKLMYSFIAIRSASIRHQTHLRAIYSATFVVSNLLNIFTSALLLCPPPPSPPMPPVPSYSHPSWYAPGPFLCTSSPPYTPSICPIPMPPPMPPLWIDRSFGFGHIFQLRLKF